ncbi:hypothetical protein H4219_004227 [Mycoemilia scoparia]|uniref:NmrA-like domain-containing protein n=1 Tax=Mycoemilia scoparia TaxID=417184 RepID=A0A9W7ZSC8_9FUNG|nr:hypothetical protein H4219_004227 [Mycoemilia scoparia]
MFGLNATPTSSAGVTTDSFHPKVLIVGGDVMCGYYPAMEFLKYKKHNPHKMHKSIRVGYMESHSPFIKELQDMGAEMCKFDLTSMDSIKKMFEGCTCAIITPPIYTKDFAHCRRMIECAKSSSDLKHCIFISLLQAEKLYMWDRLCHVYEMETQFLSHMKKWERAYVVRTTVPLEGFFFLRKMIQEKRELPWPTCSQKVSPCSMKEVSRVIRSLLMFGEHSHHESSSEFEFKGREPVATINGVSGHLAPIAGIPHDDHNHRSFCLTGMHKLSGEDMAKECSHALNTHIKLKEMSSEEFAKCLMELNKQLPHEYIVVLKQFAEVIHKGIWDVKFDDLQKLLDKKPMSIKDYFEDNSKDFKPSS